MNLEFFEKHRSWIYSAGIALLITLWVLSGSLSSDEITETVATETLTAVEAPKSSVRVRTQSAEEIIRTIVVNGKTAPARVVQLAAETDGRVELIGAEPSLASLAVDHRIAESANVPGGLPHPRVHDDRTIDADHLDLFAIGADGRVEDHVAPPGVFDVAFEFDAEGAVIPEAVEAPVDLAGGIHESPAFAQRRQGVQGNGIG